MSMPRLIPCSVALNPSPPNTGNIFPAPWGKNTIPSARRKHKVDIVLSVANKRRNKFMWRVVSERGGLLQLCSNCAHARLISSSLAINSTHSRPATNVSLSMACVRPSTCQAFPSASRKKLATTLTRGKDHGRDRARALAKSDRGQFLPRNRLGLMVSSSAFIFRGI